MHWLSPLSFLREYNIYGLSVTLYQSLREKGSLMFLFCLSQQRFRLDISKRFFPQGVGRHWKAPQGIITLLGLPELQKHLDNTPGTGWDCWGVSAGHSSCESSRPCPRCQLSPPALTWRISLRGLKICSCWPGKVLLQWFSKTGRPIAFCWRGKAPSYPPKSLLRRKEQCQQ